MTRSKRILIYEEFYKSRSFFFNLIVSKKLIDQGFNVKICLSGNDIRYHYINFKPNIVICPSLGFDIAHFFRSINPSVIIINNQQEQDRIISNLHYHRADEFLYSNINFLWSNNCLNKNFINKENLVTKIVGPTRYYYTEFVKNFEKSKAELIKKSFYEKYNLDKNKITICYALDNSSLYNPKRFENTYNLLDPTRSEYTLELQNYSNLIYNWITLFAKQYYEKAQFIIKVKPGTNTKFIINEFKKRNLLKNIKIISHEEPLVDIISFSDKFITRISTSLIDSILLKKPTAVVLLDKLKHPRNRLSHVIFAKKYLFRINNFIDFKNFILGHNQCSDKIKEVKNFYNINYKKNIKSFIKEVNNASKLPFSNYFDNHWKINFFTKYKVWIVYNVSKYLDLLFGPKIGRPRVLTKSHLEDFNFIKFFND